MLHYMLSYSNWRDTGSWWQASRCIWPWSPRPKDTQPQNVSFQIMLHATSTLLCLCHCSLLH